MIKTVVFDIGNVLADFCWEEYLSSFGFTQEVYEILANAIFKNSVWNERDRGSEPEAYYIERCKENAGHLYDREVDMIFLDMWKAVKPFPFACDWIKAIKDQGYQVLLLSNYSEMNFIYAKQHFEFLNLPDGGVISYEEKLIKPEPKIYERLLERYHLIPEETLFIDDLIANINGAKAFGIQTIHAISHEYVVEQLNSMGIDSTRR